MKTLLLIIAVFFYAQPLQAGYCDMDSGQPAPMHLEHDIDGGADSDHDCCDGADSPDPRECSHAIQCAPCLSGVFSFQSSTQPANPLRDSQVPARIVGALSPSHSAPLFRPPIS